MRNVTDWELNKLGKLVNNLAELGGNNRERVIFYKDSPMLYLAPETRNYQHLCVKDMGALINSFVGESLSLLTFSAPEINDNAVKLQF